MKHDELPIFVAHFVYRRMNNSIVVTNSRNSLIRIFHVKDIVHAVRLLEVCVCGCGKRGAYINWSMGLLE